MRRVKPPVKDCYSSQKKQRNLEAIEWDTMANAPQLLMGKIDRSSSLAANLATLQV